MREFLRSTARLFPVLAVLGVAGCAAAPGREPTPRLVSPDTSLVRRELERWYEDNERAFLAKDVPRIMALRAADFHSVTPDGTVRDRATMEQYTIELFRGIDRWIDMSFRLDSLDVSADLASAVVRQHVVRMALRSDGKIHHVDTWVTQRETWRRTGDGWKLYRVDNLRDQRRMIDGLPARDALEGQYEKIAAAYRDSTPEVILDLRTPDFSVELPDGGRWNAEQSAGYTRAAFQQVARTLALSFTIRELDVRGDTAAALIHQQWSRIQMKAGQRRRLDTSACQRETWLRTADGWKLHLIDRIQPLVWTVDGKRIDPAKPYDPAAPPYTPEKEVSSPCVR